MGAAEVSQTAWAAPAHIELFGTLQFGAAPSGTESFFGEAAERGAEVDQGGLVQVEDVGVQVKAVALGNGQAVQVGHAKDKRTGPVGQAAGRGAEGFPGSKRRT